MKSAKNYLQRYCRTKAIFECSALTKKGIEKIKPWIVSRLPLSPRLYPEGLVADRPERHFVAELIREHIFNIYRKEIPYNCEVRVTDFKERSRTMKDFIVVDIIVQHPAQKGIIIGHSGTLIKQLSERSREAIESFLGRRIFLDIRVVHNRTRS